MKTFFNGKVSNAQQKKKKEKLCDFFASKKKKVKLLFKQTPKRTRFMKIEKKREKKIEFPFLRIM